MIDLEQFLHKIMKQKLLWYKVECNYGPGHQTQRIWYEYRKSTDPPDYIHYRVEDYEYKNGCIDAVSKIRRIKKLPDEELLNQRTRYKNEIKLARQMLINLK